MANCVMRVTITGVDSGGYVFENVFYVQGTFTTESMYVLATNLASYLASPFLDDYKDVFPSTCKILTLSVASVDPDPGLSAVRVVNENGVRGIVQSSGTLAVGLKLVPDDGVPPLGHQYVPCVGDGDVVADLLDDPSSFDGLAAAYANIDGSATTYAWQLGIWGGDPKVFREVDIVSVMAKPVVLSKRQRA